ncbi:AAA family ATPase [Chitinophaga silvatica]|uniref:AAA family ATPase n=1 Tax=Chitinophaga silvatica TaxID=2282649 RepID=UPI0018F1603F|nr:AAA family ATPase [Chitinophaga silvatica]
MKQHCYVITGGPGMGKTSLINSLNQMGYKTIQESGRNIIQQQLASNGNALPWENQHAFAMKMWEADFEAYTTSDTAVPTFFDRGFPDVIGYLRLCALPVSDLMLQTAMDNRYNQHVFITPPWKAIYHQDDERKQSFAEAEDTYIQMKQLYTQLGYRVIELPLVPIAERIEFILSNL